MKQESNYVLSVRAKEDIKHVARFTIKKFGVDQSIKYSKNLETILNNIGLNPELGRPYTPTKRKMLFRYRYKAHMIFYYPTKKGIFVVRVLGGKMDFLRHIK